MWICPYCNQRFKHTNQSHSCNNYSIENHLNSTIPKLQNIYTKIVDEIKQFGPFDIVGKKGEILFRRESTFLSIRFMKSKVRVIFFLDHLDCDPPVNRFTEISRNRIIHQVDIHSEDEIDDRLLLLLAQSYDVIE